MHIKNLKKKEEYCRSLETVEIEDIRGAKLNLYPTWQKLQN